MERKEQDRVTNRPDQALDDRQSEIINVVDSLP